VATEVHYREASLTAILNSWAKGYEADGKKEVTKAEVVSVDPVSNIVVFKLFTEDYE
jgi:hypothetical protein